MHIRNVIFYLIRTTILLFLFFGTQNTFAQSQQIILEKEINTIAEIISQIEKQTDFLFVYNESEIDIQKPISIQGKKGSVSEILQAALDKIPFSYEINKKNIILYAKQKTGQEDADIRVSGFVLDESGEALTGANILIKGSSDGVISDIDGKFLLKAPKNAILIISYLGYINQEIKVSNGSMLKIILKEDSKLLNDVVVVGYGTLKRKEITGSHTSVQMNTIPPVGGTTITHFLSGKAAGLTASLASAQPGGRVNLQIRGSASNRNPLIVIDGFPITSSFSNASAGEFGAGDTDAILASVNPNDILSIDILKDASATSIYGSKAAGGVILITTKRGTSKEPKVEVTGNIGWSFAYNLPELLNANDFMIENNRVIKERYMYDNQIAPYGSKQWNDPTLPTYRDRYLPEDFDVWNNRRGTNWFNKISRVGKVQNYGANIQGGGESSKYFASFGYFDQEGIIINNNYEKFTAQINIDQKFRDKARFGVTLNANRTNMDNIPLQDGYAEASDLIRTALQFPSNLEVKNPSDEYTINQYASFLSNPVSILDISNKTKNDRLMGNLYFAYDLFPGLELKVRGGADIYMSQGFSYIPTTSVLGAKTKGRADKRIDEKNDYQLQFTASYNNTLFGKHSINALFVSEYIQSNLQGTRSTGWNFPSDNFLWNYLGLAADRASIGSYGSKSETLAYIGRFNYSFDEKYFLTANLRVDGSSNFAKNHQWGYFPGVSLGWNIAQESFMENLRPTIGQLKLRAGYGQTGNDNIGTAFSNYYVPGDLIVWGEQVVASIKLGGLGNPDLKWETQTDFNLGIDFDLWQGRLSGTMEYFNRVITDILGWKPLLSTGEATGITANLDQKKQTYGYELTLNSQNIRMPDFSWNTNFTYTFYRDRWLKRDESWRPDIYDSEKAYFGELWYHLSDGLVQEGEELSYTTGAIPGTVKLKDIDGYLKDENGKIILDENNIPKRTGAPDGILNNADKVLIGINTPFTIGLANMFKYKNLDLDIGIYGVFNRWMTNATYALLTDATNMEQGLNQVVDVKNRWNSDNRTGVLPSSLQRFSGFETGNYYLSKAWYIRISNIDFGYKIPFHKGYFRIFAALQNPFLITPYKGMDPESDSRPASLPNQRTYSVGFQLYL
ncbi:MAG: TonB-dependent receptor [Tannerellaceae bacterium]|jgi:TonB-linked SusC/RagA family outer membrane protein|nr:TonB-dependent receptor [Tannerellaceae bacterium]